MDGKTGEQLAALRSEGDKSDESDKIKANHSPSSTSSRGLPYKDRFIALGARIMTPDAYAEPSSSSTPMEVGNQGYHRQTRFSASLFAHLLAVTHTDQSGNVTLLRVESELRRAQEPPGAEPIVRETLALADLDYPSDPLVAWKKLVLLEETFDQADAYSMSPALLAPEIDTERPHPVA
jgi:hypothetical protein